MSVPQEHKISGKPLSKKFHLVPNTPAKVLNAKPHHHSLQTPQKVNSS